MGHQLKMMKALAFSTLCISGALYLHLHVLDRNFLEKTYLQLGLFEYSAAEWWILFLCALAAWPAAVHLCPDNRTLEKALQKTPLPRFFAVMTCASIATAVCAVALTLHAPMVFGRFIEETQLIAVLQEVFILFGLVALILAGLEGGKAQLPRLMGISGQPAIFVMVTAILFLFLEEISYGQHYFQWSTPEQFANNIQNETNLHNFYTNRFELVYYSGALAMFVVLPLIKVSLPSFLPRNVSFYVPPIAMAVIALPMCALSYSTWSIVPLQFYATLMVAICVVIVVRKGVYWLRRAAALGALFVLTLQVLCIHSGPRQYYGYEYSEMRELVIAMLICVYGFWLWRTVEMRRKAGQHVVAQPSISQTVS